VKGKKLMVTAILTIFVLALIPKSYTQEDNQIQSFYHHDEAGLVIEIQAPSNTIPGGKLNVSVSVYCYAEGISINYLIIKIFDFKEGREKLPIGTITYVDTNEEAGYNPRFNETETRTYEIDIPVDVWDITYGEVSCQWEFGGHTFNIRDDGFTMTYVQNVKMGELIEQLSNKTIEYEALWKNYTELNQTYWDLKINQTSSMEMELSNARLAMVILIAITVFFIATTLYLMVKRPREYW